MVPQATKKGVAKKNTEIEEIVQGERVFLYMRPIKKERHNRAWNIAGYDPTPPKQTTYVRSISHN